MPEDESGSKFGERLELALRVRQKDQTWLAEQLDVSDQAITKYKNTGQVSRENALKMSRLLDVNPHWLFENIGFGPVEGLREARPLPNTGRVPVVGTAQLGDGGYWAELEYPVGHGDGYVLYETSDTGAYALRCRGESMKPRIKPNEFVIVEPSRTPAPGDEVLVKDVAGRVMVKEWLYTRDETVHLLSVNEAHGKITIPSRELVLMQYVADIAKPARFVYE